MDVISSIAELRTRIADLRRQGKSVGLVPTMGYLHEGHLTLMRQARKCHDIVVTSIFVNPLQFGPSEDYAVYPRDIERDSELAAAAGVDMLFTPQVEEMYPGGAEQLLAFVDIKDLGSRLCGASRPGHFRGVATVVNKLFNIVQPNAAYFGQKDAQQVVILKKMVKDLNMNLEIVTVPIVREKDGLALSSRNCFLNPAERQAALTLSKSLRLAEAALQAGERSVQVIVGNMRNMIQSEPLATIDYISVVHPENLAELAVVEGQALIALAVRIGKTRLIDNMIWEG